MKIKKSISIKDRLIKLKHKKRKVKFNLNKLEKADNQKLENDSSFVTIVNTSSETAIDEVDKEIFSSNTSKFGNLELNNNINRTPSFLSTSKKAKKRKLENSNLKKNSSLLQSTITDSSEIVVGEDILDDVDKFKKKFKSRKYTLNHFFDEIHSSNTFDSRLLGEKCFFWLISPYTIDDFKKNCWEKAPLFLKRNQKNYYGDLFSIDDLENIIKENDLEYTKNIDIAVYKNNERFTYNPDGKVYSALIWNQFLQGNSIRLLNPQTFSKNIWKLCSILQEFFNSFVGSNVYLTPPDSQGFAPHYDDIEAFILQLEGKKIWKVYSPLDDENTLPRYPSNNFKRDDLKSSLLNVFELEAGDLLYLPRGFIHEGKTIKDEHSMHITISTSQKHTYGDLLKILLPQAIKTALQEDIEYRESLPLSYLSYMGLVKQDCVDKRRDDFLSKVKNLFSKLINYVNVDNAVDHFSKDFIHSALPPNLNKDEKKLSIVEGGEKWKENEIEDGIQIDLNTEIKLIRFNCCRLIVEENSVKLYHTLENSKVYKEKNPQYIEISSEMSSGVEFIINQYPNLCRVGDIPLDNLDDRKELANLLFDKGLLLVNESYLEKSDEFLKTDN